MGTAAASIKRRVKMEGKMEVRREAAADTRLAARIEGNRGTL